MSLLPTCTVLAAAGAALLFPLSGCGSSDGGSETAWDLPPEVEQAVASAGDPAATFLVDSSSGSIGLIRAALPQTFPPIRALVEGGQDTASMLQDAFGGEGTLQDDTMLALFAYALEERGDDAVLPVLRSFLAANATAPLFLSGHFVAHAIRALQGKQEWIDETSWYYGPELDEAAAAGVSTAALSRRLSGGTQNVAMTCERTLIVQDEAGQDVMVELNGVRQPLVVGGKRWACKLPPEAKRNEWLGRVVAGGGTYVDDDPKFPGEPHEDFNCAGYAFRHFNDGEPWTAPPDRFLLPLSKAGLLVEVTDRPPEPGELVFYMSSPGGTPGHVAVVQEVTTAADGAPLITVRNADNQSGLFEARIDAAYFRQTPYRKVYRWATGAPPSFRKDQRSAASPRDCDNVALDPAKCPGREEEGGGGGGGGAEGELTGRIYLGTTPSGEPGPLGMGLYVVYPGEGGRYTQFSPRAIDGVAVSPGGKLLAAGMLADSGGADPQLAIFDTSDRGAISFSRAIFKVLPWHNGPQQLTGPAFVNDGLLVVSRVGDLHLYDLTQDKGSKKIWAGWRSSASWGSNLLVVETDGGLRGVMNVNAGAYANYDPWNVDPGLIEFLTEDPAKLVTVQGSGTSWIRPKFSPDGQRLVVIDESDPSAVQDFRLNVAGSVTDLLTYRGPGGKVLAATFSPDGKQIAFAVEGPGSASGGLWIIRQGDWQGRTAKRVVAAEVSNVWKLDLAWGP